MLFYSRSSPADCSCDRFLSPYDHFLYPCDRFLPLLIVLLPLSSAFESALPRIVDLSFFFLLSDFFLSVPGYSLVFKRVYALVPRACYPQLTMGTNGSECFILAMRYQEQLHRGTARDSPYR